MTVLRSLVLLLVLPSLAFARNQNTAKAAPTPAKPQGFRAEFLANLDEVQSKILELAESVPADKYSWRPGPGVRSISEVYMHVAGGNYFLASFLGVDAPKQKGDIEMKITKKAEVLAELRRSFDHLRNAANGTSDLEKSVKMFGQQTTHRGVMITMLTHLHEHLGQAVAYARMNGVVPPWSR